MFDEDEVVRVYVPPGWPPAVRPPGAPDWVRTAVGFLLDCCPGKYRRYDVLLRHPRVLARFAREQVAAQLVAANSNLGGMRSDLAELVDGNTLEAAVVTVQREQARLVRLERAVNLVEQALRDVRFVPKL